MFSTKEITLITMKEMVITTKMTKIITIKDTTTDDITNKMITSTNMEESLDEVKTMKIKRINHVNPFSARHVSMKDINT